MARSICNVEGCEKPINARGLCNTHQYRIKKFGNVYARTTGDKNTFIIKDDVVIMDLFNKHGVKICETLFNLKHLNKVTSHKWCMKEGLGGYVVSYMNGKIIRLSRYLNNTGDNFVVDHKDGNTLNNLDDNLRETVQSKNSMNCKLSKNNTSGHSGVSWLRNMNQWRAYIMIDRKQIQLGTFIDLNDAILARKEAEIKYFGEFSRLYGESEGE